MTFTKFAPRNDADITQLVTRHPLAWIISQGNPSNATPLPLRPEQVENDRIVTLTGHYARSNPQVGDLQSDPRASLLFLGPNGYVSPSWLSDRTQAPTWNYASINFDVRIDFLDNPHDLDRIVRDLVEAMEGDRQRRWSVEEMGERYRQLLTRIIPFRAHVLATHAKFKLGQDERDDAYPEIISGLSQTGNEDLIELMTDANANRTNRHKPG
ncbi:MAG: FMN-binding negative transcriptional regulator [Rhodanobacter sp.]|jgi:transcriptional regulator